MRWVASFLVFSGCVRTFSRLEIETPTGTSTGTCSGRIVDDLGAPIPSAFISARGVRGRTDGQSGPDGTFALTLDPDVHALELSASGYVSRTLPPFQLAAGETVALGDVVLGLQSDETDPTIATFSIGTISGLVPSHEVLVHVEAFDNRVPTAFALTNGAADCSAAVFDRTFDACSNALCRADVTFALAAGVDGPREISLCVRDAAGRFTPSAVLAQVTLDTTPPPRVTGVIIAPRSAAFIATYNPASEPHLSHYELAYSESGAPDFTGGNIVASDGTALDIVVRDLLNRMPYTVAVRACDRVGWCSEPSAPLTVTIGTRSQKLALPVSDSLSTGPTITAFDNELWIAGTRMISSTEEAIALYTCNIDVTRCERTEDWAAVDPLPTNMNAAIPRTPVSPVLAVTAKQRLAVWTEVNGSGEHIGRSRVCTAPANCLDAASWVSDAASFPVLSSRVAPTVATNRELVLISQQDISGRVWLAMCVTSQCTQSNHFSKLPLPVLAQEPPQLLPEYGRAQPGSASELTPSAWFHAYPAASLEGGDGALALATTALGTPLASASTTRFDAASGYVVSPALAQNKESLFVAYWRWDVREAELWLHDCALSSGCDELADFSPGEVIATASDVDSEALSVRLTRGVRAVEVLWQRADRPETHLDIVGPQSVRQTLYSAYSESFAPPAVVFRGTNWWGVSSFDDGYLWLRSPSLQAPRDFEATPTLVGADVRWGNDPDTDGYLLRGETEMSIASAAAVQLPLSSATELDVRSTSGGERSDPSPSVRVAPFGAVTLLDGEESLTLTAAGEQLFAVTKKGSAHTLRQCASGCESAASWRSFTLGSVAELGAGISVDRSISMVVTPHTVYAGGVRELDGAATLRACARTDDCGVESSWTALTNVAGNSTSGLGFSSLYGLAYDGERVLITGRANAAAGNPLAYVMCTESGPKACASTGWSTFASAGTLTYSARVAITGFDGGFAATMGPQSGVTAAVTLLTRPSTTFPTVDSFFPGLPSVSSVGAAAYTQGPAARFFMTTSDGLYHYACNGGLRCFAPFGGAPNAAALWTATRLDSVVPGSRVSVATDNGIVYAVYNQSVDRMRIAACRERCDERSSWMLGALQQGFIPANSAIVHQSLGASNGKLHFAELYGASNTLRVLTGGVFEPRESRE